MQSRPTGRPAWVWRAAWCASTALTAAAAAGGQEGEKPFRFAVYGGTQGNDPAHHAVVAQIVKNHPEIVLHAGEAVAPGASARDWRTFYQFTKPLSDICPIYGVRGPGQRKAFCLPLDGFPDPNMRGDAFYSFDYRGCHFVFLDTELRVEKNEPQTRWLDADLAAAQGKPTFVILYRAIFGAAARNILPMGEFVWHPIIARHKVRAVFQGGRHLYHRTRVSDVTYVISGGGGGMLDYVDARRQIIAGDVAGNFHHFLEVAVSPDEVRCRVIDSEGETRDEFLIPPRPAVAQAKP